MNILVTGGAGFIGSHIVDSLVEKGWNVTVLDNLSSGKKENLNKKAKFVNKDIRDDLESVFEKGRFDVVYHLASQINVRKSIENPKEDAETNIIGSLNIVHLCAKHKVKKIIFSSTGGAIYGAKEFKKFNENDIAMPLSPYGIAKYAVESYLRFYRQVYGLDYVILRYSNVYGPRQNAQGEAGVIAVFANSLINDKDVNIYGDGNQTRDFVYVKDVVRANLLALRLKGTFNVSTGREITINQLTRMMIFLSKSKSKVKHLQPIKGEIRRSCLSYEKIARYGWKPEYSLQRGLREVIDWFR